MKTQHVLLSDLHFEHNLWINELKFVKDEMGILENRLGELAIRNTGMEVMSNVEHFQNQFILQKEVLDELKHDISVHEQNISKYAHDHPIAIDHVYFSDHDGLRGRVEKFRELYNELKVDFLKFVSKWL